MRSHSRRLTRRIAGVLATGTLVAAVGAPALAAPVGATAVTPVGGAALGSSGLALQAPGATRLPRLTASAWLLADLETGEVLAAQDAHGRLRPASTLKVLTAVTLMPRLDPATVYTGRPEDANAEGSKVGVVPGATYTVGQLWQGLFLMSGNDAASALANAAGGVPSTVTAMAAKAKELGALDTTVRNPSGLDAPGQVTSAYDLALFARAGMVRPDFRAYATTVRAQFPGKMPKAGHVRKTFQIYTQDRLLLNYPGAIGVKTGWTTKARGTFVGAATRHGRTLVATVLHTKAPSWTESRALLDWGFRNSAALHPVGTLDTGRKTTQAAALPHPGKGVSAASAPQAAGSASLPGWAWVPVLLLVAVVALRARVLVRRRARRGRRPPPRRPAY